jgi:histidinol-phosphatase (PHP family)
MKTSVIKQNLHTHTTYCDGKDTPEEIIEQAISLGFDSIGFSGHSYMHYAPDHSMSEEGTEAYKKEIRNLKQKYKGQIKVYCGIEFDMYSVVDLRDYDYVIGTVHYLYLNGQYIGFDRSADVVKRIIDEHFGGDGLAYARAYYEALARLPEHGRTDIVGHFDLITKHAEKEFFFDTESKRYRDYALEALSALKEKVRLFEVNTGAIARGYRTTPYPAPFILKEIKSSGCGIVISSDCHDRRQLNCSFTQAAEYVKACGFDEVFMLKDGHFEGQKI